MNPYEDVFDPRDQLNPDNPCLSDALEFWDVARESLHPLSLHDVVTDTTDKRLTRVIQGDTVIWVVGDE